MLVDLLKMIDALDVPTRDCGKCRKVFTAGAPSMVNGFAVHLDGVELCVSCSREAMRGATEADSDGLDRRGTARPRR